MRLKIGIFASSLSAALVVIESTVKWIIGTNDGKLFKSEDGSAYTDTTVAIFDESSVNSVSYQFNSSSSASNISQIEYSGTLWSTVNIGFAATTIRSIAYGNGIWVAAGETGQMRKSTDGTTWTTVTSNMTGNITSVAYSDGVWVAAGAAGQIRRSTDATAWTTVTSNFGATAINHVQNGASLWIACGYVGQMRSSTDGIVWGAVTSNFGTGGISEVKHANGLWIATPILNSGNIRISTNGSVWTTVVLPGAGRCATYFKKEWYIPISGVYSRNSTDGTTWTTKNFNIDESLKIYAPDIRLTSNKDSIFVFGSSPAVRSIIKSFDGITWFDTDSNLTTGDIKTIEYGNAIWVAGGSSGVGTKSSFLNPSSKMFLAIGDSSKLATSSDGNSWTSLSLGGSNDYKTINFIGNKYYAGGQ